MRRVLPLLLGAVGTGFIVILVTAKLRSKTQGAVISYDPPAQSPKGSGYMPTTVIPKQLTAEIVASAQKWAHARGLPVQEVLATILVESSGKPRAWANKANEDSRGLMQINIRAWKPFLDQNGLTVEDLWDVDKNIMVGTYIYAKYRREVQDLIAQSGTRQSLPIGTLTRLYYKGPAYVKKKILAKEDASHPYKNAEQAIANWDKAMAKVAAVA